MYGIIKSQKGREPQEKREVIIMTNYYRDNHITHFAYNLETLEVLGNTKGSALKRAVKWHQHYARKYGEPVGKWVFAHGADAYTRIAVKAQRLIGVTEGK